jgi:hypothetical protein
MGRPIPLPLKMSIDDPLSLTCAANMVPTGGSKRTCAQNVVLQQTIHLHPVGRSAHRAVYYADGLTGPLIVHSVDDPLRRGVDYDIDQVRGDSTDC